MGVQKKKKKKKCLVDWKTDDMLESDNNGHPLTDTPLPLGPISVPWPAAQYAKTEKMPNTKAPPTALETNHK